MQRLRAALHSSGDLSLNVRQPVEVLDLKRRPYGFLERFDPDFTPNTTDLSGRRYSYRSQTMIGHWNIGQLANAFIAGGILDQVTYLLPDACFKYLNVNLATSPSLPSHACSILTGDLLT